MVRDAPIWSGPSVTGSETAAAKAALVAATLVAASQTATDARCEHPSLRGGLGVHAAASCHFSDTETLKTGVPSRGSIWFGKLYSGAPPLPSAGTPSISRTIKAAWTAIVQDGIGWKRLHRAGDCRGRCWEAPKQRWP
jgi:hypothetical protein